MNLFLLLILLFHLREDVRNRFRLRSHKIFMKRQRAYGTIEHRNFRYRNRIFTYFLLYSDTIKTSLYKFYTCAVIFFFSVVLLYVLPNIASPLIDFFLEMLLVFILLTDKWYNKIVSFVLVYILDSLLYQALALICDLILGFPIFVGMNTVKEKI